MRLTYLTNHVSAYRVSTLVALSRQVDEMVLLLTGVDVAPGLDRAPIRMEMVSSLRIQRTRRHPTGYAEGYEVHLPFGTFGALRRERARDVFAVEFGLRTALAVVWRMLGRDRRLVVHADLSEATERGRGGARKLLRKLMLRCVDVAMVNGSSGARYLRALGCPAGKIAWLPYASDMPRFEHTAELPEHAPAHAPLQLLYVGRLVQVKGLVPFLERLIVAMRAHPERRVRLTLVGDGDQAATIDALQLPRNLSIERVGAVEYDAVAGYYAGCDVTIMPSLGDTWGLCVSESMAAGRPVLGSIGAQAVEELVVEGVTGWQFDATDVASLDAALHRMLCSTPAERATLGRNARRAASELSPERVARCIVDAFRRSRGVPPLDDPAEPARASTCARTGRTSTHPARDPTLVP